MNSFIRVLAPGSSTRKQQRMLRSRSGIDCGQAAATCSVGPGRFADSGIHRSRFSLGYRALHGHPHPLLMKIADVGRLGEFFWWGTLAGASLLLNPAHILVLGLILSTLWIMGSVSFRLAITVGATALIIGPWIVRNNVELGYPRFSVADFVVAGRHHRLLEVGGSYRFGRANLFNRLQLLFVRRINDSGPSLDLLTVLIVSDGRRKGNYSRCYCGYQYHYDPHQHGPAHELVWCRNPFRTRTRLCNSRHSSDELKSS
jgi:hypothetical protein